MLRRHAVHAQVFPPFKTVTTSMSTPIAAMQDIIDIPSSPDSSPRVSAKPIPSIHNTPTKLSSKGHKLPLFYPEETDKEGPDDDPDVIEILDTDEEEERPAKKRRFDSENARAGPSSLQPAAGSSKGKGTAIPSSRSLRPSGSSIQIIE